MRSGFKECSQKKRKILIAGAPLVGLGAAALLPASLRVSDETFFVKPIHGLPVKALPGSPAILRVK
jgi:hypothetical protein